MRQATGQGDRRIVWRCRVDDGFREYAGYVAGIGAKVEHLGKVSLDVEEPLAEARCDLIAEVVYLSACLGVRGGAFFLLVFGVAIEYLQSRRARRLDGIVTTAWRRIYFSTGYPSRRSNRKQSHASAEDGFCDER